MARVLIADDDRLIRAIVGEHLRRRGHDVIEAADGLEALRLAREELPDCLVLDVMMPQARGLEVCREIRADPGPQPGIVMLSGRIRHASQCAGLDAGADGYLSKPVDSAALFEEIDRALRLRGRPA